jgi:hypothetical protein
MPVKIFCCYAREDEMFLNKLKTHLVPLQRQGLIELWHDQNISAGTAWEQEISNRLNEAQIILLLISPDFMDSDYCYSIEMKRALELHESGIAHVIPIILRPVHWQGILGKLQVLPKDALPVTDPDWHNIDRALYNITEGIYKIIETLPVQNTIEFAIQEDDITLFDADVLALKYAQAPYGTDDIVAQLLMKEEEIDINAVCPAVGDYRYLETRNRIQAHHALFVGVPDILEFSYQDIRAFAAQVLSILSDIAPATRHLIMTVHGVGFGLDEIEALFAQFAGYLQAFQNEQFPPKIEKITIIEKNSARVKRLRQALAEYFSPMSFISQVDDRWIYRLHKNPPEVTIQSNQQYTQAREKAKIASDAKPHVFVAMPFKKDMDDVFYYGIQQPVRAAGFICERVDQEAFIGDILDQVKKKIETSVIVIAELTGANPNVYLEIGYAWGKGRPTLLLIKDEQELRFDVRGHRCLTYERIKDLEEALTKELKELASRGFV